MRFYLTCWWQPWAILGCIMSTSPAAMAAGVTIHYTCGDGSNSAACAQEAQKWAKQTGNRVNLVSMPASSTEQLSLYQQLLSSHSSDIDVIMVDTTWSGILNDHLANLNTLLPGDLAKGQIASSIANNTVNGNLKAMPFYADASLLYYRKDLLEKYHRQVPVTWQQMTDSARYIQEQERAAGNRSLWGYVFQGKAYEGLTCNVLEWVASDGGGVLLDQHGNVEVDTPAVRSALKRAGGWIGTIAPKGVLSYEEETSRGVFQSGNAVFMRNWPYVWALSQSPNSVIKGKVGVAPLPAGDSDGGRHASTLGGWSLAVSRYSQHPRESAELVAWLTRKENQKQRAIEFSFLPTYTDLYSDPQVLEASPFIGHLLEPIKQAVPRPAGLVKTLYPRYSNAIFDRSHRVLGGEASVDQAVDMLNRDMQRLVRRADFADAQN
ncbi:putative ABC transporter-binding protein [Carnimonas sp. LMG 33810]